MAKNNNDKWFQAGKSLNWSKSDSQTTRRRNALKARKGNYLKAGRALQALANVTTDAETARKARSDARYFFEKNRTTKKTKRRKR